MTLSPRFQAHVQLDYVSPCAPPYVLVHRPLAYGYSLFRYAVLQFGRNSLAFLHLLMWRWFGVLQVVEMNLQSSCSWRNYYITGWWGNSTWFLPNYNRIVGRILTWGNDRKFISMLEISRLVCTETVNWRRRQSRERSRIENGSSDGVQMWRSGICQVQLWWN